MSTDALLFLVASAAELGLAIAVLLRDPRGEANRALFFFLLAVSIWSGSNFVLRLIQNPEAAEIIHQLGGLGFCLFPSLFLHFSFSFVRYRLLDHRWVYFIIYAPAVVLITLHTLGNVTTVQQVSHGFQTVHGPSYLVYVTWIMLGFSWALALLGKFAVQAKPRRFQVLLFIFGIAIPLVTGIAMDVLHPPLDLESFPTINVSILIGSMLFAAALFDTPIMTPSPEEVASKVLRSVADLVCVTTMEGAITFASESFRRTLGYGVQENLTTLRIGSFMDKADQILTLGRSTHDADEKPLLLETYYRTKGDVRIPVLLSVSRLQVLREPFGLVLAARDLTERHELARRAEESQEKYRQIVEGSLDGIVIIQDGRLVFVNPSAVKIFGYDSAYEMKGAAFEERVAPGSKPFVIPADRNRIVGDDILRNMDMKGLSKSGKVIDLEINAKLVSWNGRPAVLASFRDITERKQLEREQVRWFWEQESLTAIDRRLVAMVDLQKVLEAISRHARLLTRVDFAGVVMVDPEREHYLWRTVTGNKRPMAQNWIPVTELHMELFGKKKALTIQNFGGDPRFPVGQFPILSAEGLVTVSAFPLLVESRFRGLLIVGFRKEHEFTEREMRLLGSLAEKSSIALANAELYENLLLREKELERLWEARGNAQEEERRRIAQELHDGLGQMLTAIKFNVEIMEDTIGLVDSGKKKLAEIKTLLDNVMNETREISYNLMPSVLDDFGLVPALQLLCDQFSTRYGLKVEFQTHGVSNRLDPALEVNLYRIAQEGLNNICKHSGATGAVLQLLGQLGGIRLLIEDNGKGFRKREASNSLSKNGGMGLVSMRERVVSFKGTLDIDSTPGHGTHITVDIPLSFPEQHGKD